jgi:hypothetical protein
MCTPLCEVSIRWKRVVETKRMCILGPNFTRTSLSMMRVESYSSLQVERMATGAYRTFTKHDYQPAGSITYLT